MQGFDEIKRILLVEDNPGDADLVFEYLSDTDFSNADLTTVDTLKSALSEVNTQTYDLVLLDLNLPDAHRLDGLHQIRPQAPKALIIVLTGSKDAQLALEALKAGAQDYLLKDEISAYNLQRTITYARERGLYTERMLETEKQKLQLMRKLEQQKVVGKLVMDIQHEFRTAITRISTSSNLWARKYPSETASKYLGYINESTEVLLNTIEYIAVIMQYTQEGVTDQTISVRSVLDSEINSIYSRLNRLQIICTTDYAVAMSADALLHVFRPVIDNALFFSESDQPVIVEVTADESEVQITVQDRGIGIPEEAIDQLFLPFYKVSGARSHNAGEGVGLGLTIAHAIVTAHYGNLKVFSKLGIGTTVYIHLPRATTR